MAVIRCRKCGAVATLRHGAGGIETSHGADLHSKCKSLAERGEGAALENASECPSMEEAIRSASFRLRAPKRKRPPASAAIVPGAVPAAALRDAPATAPVVE